MVVMVGREEQSSRAIDLRVRKEPGLYMYVWLFRKSTHQPLLTWALTDEPGGGTSRQAQRVKYVLQMTTRRVSVFGGIPSRYCFWWESGRFVES